MLLVLYEFYQLGGFFFFFFVFVTITNSCFTRWLLGLTLICFKLMMTGNILVILNQQMKKIMQQTNHN